MKIYSTRDFRRNLAKCMAEAETETIYVQRPGNGLVQITLVPPKDVKSFKRHSNENN